MERYGRDLEEQSDRDEDESGRRKDRLMREQGRIEVQRSGIPFRQQRLSLKPSGARHLAQLNYS